MQALGRDASGFGGELIDRDERPAREDVPSDAGKDHDQRQAEHEDHQDLRGAVPQPLL